MKRFIRNIIGFLLAFCVLQFLLNAFVLKDVGIPFTHNKRFATKYSYYLQHDEKFNALFLGSSHTYRQINPLIIDEQLYEYNMTSFNLGAPATFSPESFYLLEKLLEKNSSHAPVSYIFMELTDITTPKLVNWLAPQSFYFIDNAYLSLVWKALIIDSNMNALMKAKRMYPFLQGYVLKHLFLLPELQVKAESNIFLGPEQNGYYPLELDLQQNETPRLLERRTLFVVDTSIIQTRIKAQQKEIAHSASRSYTDFLNALIDKADRYGVGLYYIIPPKLKNYPALKEIKFHIRAQRVIDLGSYKSYPDLYRAKYWFDQGHFNRTGADIYSGYLAKAIREKLEAKADY